MWRSLVSALVWGTRGPRFKSGHPDREKALLRGPFPVITGEIRLSRRFNPLEADVKPSMSLGSDTNHLITKEDLGCST